MKNPHVSYFHLIICFLLMFTAANQKYIFSKKSEIKPTEIIGKWDVETLWVNGIQHKSSDVYTFSKDGTGLLAGSKIEWFLDGKNLCFSENRNGLKHLSRWEIIERSNESITLKTIEEDTPTLKIHLVTNSEKVSLR